MGFFTEEVSETEAERAARSMLPVCLISHRDSDDNSCYMRPELNVKHDNPTACVLLDLEQSVLVYAKTLTYPTDMNLLKFTQDRNVSHKKRICQ